jgi:lipopolysaccharide/colanic/teichoic acid biosynthesis glycosyltransferase
MAEVAGVTDAPPKRIAYVVTDPMTVRLLLRGQLGYFRRRGYAVVVLCAPGAGVEETAAAEGVEARTVPLVRRPAPLRDLLALGHLVVALRRLRPDLVHASTPKAGLLGLLAARLGGVRGRLYTLRGLPLETASGLRRLVLALGERLAMASAQRVVCVSESLRRRALELRLAPAAKLRVLAHGSSNGVDAARFAGVRADESRRLRAELGIGEGDWVLGYVGRLTRDKGVADLWQLLRRLRTSQAGVRLLLVGDFEEGDALPQTLRRAMAADPDCIVTGFVGDAAPYYRLMDVLVFASRREGFPNVPLEAAAAGVPTVAYAATGTVDAVLSGETGVLVEVGDVDGLVRAVETYRSEPALLREHGEAARRRVREHIRHETVWSELASLYERLLGPPGAVTPRREPMLRCLADLLLAVAGLLLAAPVLLVVAALVRLTMGSPVLFRQVRIGHGACPFTLLKFRTMRDAIDAQGRELPDSERLTRFGAFLRRSSLDEVPELLNVLRGDMSFVGPRPLLPEYLELYTRDQARRHEVKPGITGWAQVNGRNETTWEERLRHDVWYVDHRSVRLDLEILLRTVVLVLRGKGISADGHATMPRFRGSS